MSKQLENFKETLKRQINDEPVQLVKDYIEQAIPKAGDKISIRIVVMYLQQSVARYPQLTQDGVIERAIDELIAESKVTTEGELIIKM